LGSTVAANHVLTGFSVQIDLNHSDFTETGTVFPVETGVPCVVDLIMPVRDL
jgi:hypothetical protein